MQFANSLRPEHPHSRSIAALTGLLLIIALLTGCQSSSVRAQRYFQSGRKYFDQQKYEEAAIEFQRSLKREPREWEPRYYLGQSEIKLARWQQAYRDLTAVIELRPSFAPPRLDLAEMLLLHGGAKEDRSEALAQVQDVQKDDPNNPRAQTLLIKIDAAEGEFSEGVKECAKAKQLSPGDDLVWSTCGMLETASKQLDAAESDFRHALELNRDLPNNYQNLASLLAMSGRVPEIQLLLRTGAEAHPKSSDFILLLADFYVRQKRFAEAEQLLADFENRAADVADLHRSMGDFWMAKGETDRGIKEYETQAAQKTDLVIRKKLVNAYLAAGRVSDADKLNAPILKMNPQDFEGRAFQGALDYMHGNLRPATEELQAVLKDDPKSTFASYYLGLSWMALNEPERAKAAFYDCLREEPDFIQVHLRLGELAATKNDWKAVAESAKQAITLNPRSSDSYLLLAQADMNLGNLREAGKIFDAVGKAPSPPVAFYELSAQYYALKKDTDAASKQLSEALSRSPQPLAAMSRYVQFQIAHNQMPAAIAAVQSWVAGASPDPGGCEMLARLYLGQHDLSHAETWVQKAIDLNPKAWSPHWVLGLILQQRQQTDSALHQFEQAARLDASRPAPLISAAEILMENSQYDSAKSSLEQALRLDPASVDAQSALARWYAERGQNLEVALSIAQELKKNHPDDPYIADTLGWVYYKKGVYELALEQLQPAAGQVPSSALIQFHLGMTYMQAGQKRKGEESLQRALKLGLATPSLASDAQQVLKSASKG